MLAQAVPLRPAPRVSVAVWALAATAASLHGSAQESSQGWARATFKPPIQRSVVVDGQSRPGYVLEFSNGTDVTTFECIAAKGGLVTAFKLNGVSILLESPGVDELDGSVFWPSPQSSWGWPPPPAIDPAPSGQSSASYEAAVAYEAAVDEEAMSVILTSPVDWGLGVQVAKRFSIDLDLHALVLEYTIINAGGEARSFAPWEITRVPVGGVTLYPTGLGPRTSGQFEPMQATDVAGVTWLQHGAGSANGQKLFADAGRGWIAHTDRNLVFTKCFQEIPPESIAPGEAQVEVFASPTHLEVEQQGAHVPIPPGGHSTWVVHWYLCGLPADMTAAPGSTGLVDLVDRLCGLPDCNAGYSPWLDGWSLGRKEWCCRHEGKGCEA